MIFIYILPVLIFLSSPAKGAADIKCQTRCEYSVLYIACPEDEVVTFTSAMWGRQDKTTCPSYWPWNQWSTDCQAANAMETLDSRCRGKNSCSVKADNSVFGDPCSGTEKYLKVCYTCGKSAEISEDYEITFEAMESVITEEPVITVEAVESVITEEPVITVEDVESGCQCIQEIADTTENLQNKIEELENQNNNFQDQLNTLGDRLVKLQILTHSREVCFEDLASSKCEGSQSGQVGIVEAIRVDGGWGLFSEWSQCSATCGGGSQVRNRTCNNPEPQHGGKNCIGSGEDGRKCNEEECCPDGMIRLNGNCSECLLENNYDYNGRDISGRGYTFTNNADGCAADCGRNDECSYWTFVEYTQQCWMKYSKSGRRYKEDAISGNKACSQGSLPDYDYRSTLEYGY